MQAYRHIYSIAILIGLSAAAYGQSTIVANPTTLNLNNTTGPVITRTITLTTNSTTPIPFTTTAGSTSWVTVSPTGGNVVAGTPVTLTVVADATNLTPSTYNVELPINYQGSTLRIQINFDVQVVTGLTANPATVNWTYALGGTVPAPAAIALTTSSATFTAQVVSASSWLLLGVPNPNSTFVPQGQLTSYPTAAGFTTVFQDTGLVAGAYQGYINVTDANGNTCSIQVNLTVVAAGSGFSLGASAVTLTSPGTVQTTTVSTVAPNPVAYSTMSSVITPSGGTWLSVNATGTAPTTALTITADPRGLPSGTYTGTVTASTGAAAATVTVTFVVNIGTTGSGNVVSSQSTLTFTAPVNGASPTPQIINISDQNGSSPIPFSISAVVPSGSNSWLAVQIVGGGTQGLTGTSTAAVQVSVNPVGLTAGTYVGTVNVVPSGGTALGIQVTFTVLGPSAVTASPTQLTFNYQSGGTVPGSQPITVGGTGTGLTFTVTTTTASGGSWLSAGANSGTTPATLNATVSPASLAAGVYQGTITVAGSGGSTGNIAIAVTLNVTAALPSITAVQNAASYLTGPVAPGEIVTLYGTGIGPATPVGTTLDNTGKVSINIGNVQVLFNGTAAPLTYVSATQINCVVPYELAQVTSPYVQVKYQGTGSNIFNLQLANSAPAIFAAAAGKGQGAILNGDSTYNSSSNPAPKGSTVQLYMTGEGQIVVPPTNGGGVTGSVTCSSGCATLSLIPKPALAVGALINNQPATIVFYGEAPSFVSGVMQVNVTIPPGTPSGAIPIVISVGNGQSQAGVTVAVQ